MLAAAASVFGGKTVRGDGFEPEIIKQGNAFACKSKVCDAVKPITNRKRRKKRIVYSDCQN